MSEEELRGWCWVIKRRASMSLTLGMVNLILIGVLFFRLVVK